MKGVGILMGEEHLALRGGGGVVDSDGSACLSGARAHACERVRVSARARVFTAGLLGE